MATGKRQDRRSKYANDMHIIHHEIFFSLSLSFSFSLSLSLSVLSRFLSGFFLSLSLSLFFFFWSASTISPWWLFLCVFIRAFFDYSSLPLRTAIHPTSLPFPAFLNFNPLDTWRPSWKTTVTASFHFFSWPFLFPVRHFLFQSRWIHSTFLSDYFSICLGFFFRIFRQVSFSHCVENSNDGIGFSDLWGYATVRLVFRRRFHVAGQTSGCLTRLRHTAPVQLALPQKKRCNFNYVATFLIIHLTELYTKTCYELYNPLWLVFFSLLNVD